MKIIRHGVFETNSSSTHSYSVSSDTETYETLYPDENGTITLTGGEWGWEFAKYNDVYTKVNYVAVLLQCCIKEDGNRRWDPTREYNEKHLRFLKDGEFNFFEPVNAIFEQAVKEHTGCENIVYDLTQDSYIDHQSWDNYFNDILYFSLEEMKNFLFNPKSFLYTGNDNGNREWVDGELVERSYDDDVAYFGA